MWVTPAAPKASSRAVLALYMIASPMTRGGPSAQSRGNLFQQGDELGLGFADDGVEPPVVGFRLLEQGAERRLALRAQPECNRAAVGCGMPAQDQSVPLEFANERAKCRLVPSDGAANLDLREIGVEPNHHEGGKVARLEVGPVRACHEGSQRGFLRHAQVERDEAVKRPNVDFRRARSIGPFPLRAFAFRRRRGGAHALKPPSAISRLPVVKLLRSEARKSTACAISAGR